MADSKKFTTAYTGSGKVDEGLVKNLLNGLLPEDDNPNLGLGWIFIPDGEIPPRRLSGLHKVVQWLEGEVGQEGTIPVPDLVAALVAHRDGGVAYEGADEYPGGDEVALVTVHNPDSEADAALARAAHDAGIRVIDLTHAADDMVFEDEPDDVSVPLDVVPDEGPPFDVDEAQEVTAEAAADLVTAPELADEGTVHPESITERVTEAAALGIAAAESVRSLQTSAAGITFTVSLNLDEPTINAIAQAIVKHMGQPAEAPVAAVAPVLPITGSKGKTRAFYYHEGNATYRPARGVAKDGEVRVELDDEEQQEARAKGMLR